MDNYHLTEQSTYSSTDHNVTHLVHYLQNVKILQRMIWNFNSLFEKHGTSSKWFIKASPFPSPLFLPLIDLPSSFTFFCLPSISLESLDLFLLYIPTSTCVYPLLPYLSFPVLPSLVLIGTRALDSPMFISVH